MHFYPLMWVVSSCTKERFPPVNFLKVCTSVLSKVTGDIFLHVLLNFWYFQYIFQIFYRFTWVSLTCDCICLHCCFGTTLFKYLSNFAPLPAQFKQFKLFSDEGRRAEQKGREVGRREPTRNLLHLWTTCITCYLLHKQLKHRATN